MKTRILLPSLLFAFVLFTGCSFLIVPENSTPSDPISTFEYFWNEIDEHYVFLELKGIDWNSIKSTYSAQVTSETTDEELFEVLAAMMNELQDGHCNLFAPFSLSRYAFYNDSPENFNTDILSATVEDIYYTGPLVNGFIRRPEGVFGYIRYSSFMDAVSEYDMTYVINRFEEAGALGIVLDIRNNGGGMILNVYTLISFFTEEEVEIYDCYIKTAPETYAFYETVSVEPADTFYSKPVCLLTNRSCYSASSFTATGFKALPNVVQVGDQTGGGMGLPTGAELPNGWEFRISTTVNLAAASDSIADINDENYNFERGVPADIDVDMNSTDETSGIDTILETALDNILSRSGN